LGEKAPEMNKFNDWLKLCRKMYYYQKPGGYRIKSFNITEEQALGLYNELCDNPIWPPQITPDLIDPYMIINWISSLFINNIPLRVKQ